MSERLKILLAGMVAGDPRQGGASWAVLQYVAGFRSLGHEVLLVEPMAAGRLDLDPRISSYFEGLPILGGGAALLEKGGGRTVGLAYEQLVEFAAEADLLVNISGMLRDERLLERIPVRAFLDLDPGFNQVWHETGSDMGLDLHTDFLTVGQRVGDEGCPVPTCGRNWLHTLPPVSLEHWPFCSEAATDGAFTSIGHWRSYGSIEHDGIHYGQRAHSLRRLIDLPRRTDVPLRLAVGIHEDETADLTALRSNGWELVDPFEVAATPDLYAGFIRASRGELCVAKAGYVDSGSGWFSDRSACYLASGRPVVAQETGFDVSLPLGEGLLGFSTAAEAADALSQVESQPARHAAAARDLAEEHLDASKVLAQMLDRLAGGREKESF